MTDEKTTAEPSGASGGSQAWIPVTERLPDDGADVMGFALPDYTNLARYDAVEGRFWCVTGGWFNPTHWMPIPAPLTTDESSVVVEK